MKFDPKDHTKQYRMINGHPVCISFSNEANPNLFAQIRDILISCTAGDPFALHICRENHQDDTITPSEKEAS